MLSTPFVFAHGIDVRVEQRYPGVLVSASYSGGSALSYASVQVFFEDQKVDFQNGRSDRNGRFCFVPDKPGNWYLLIDDEMGHAERIEIKVVPSFFDNTPAKGGIKENEKPDFYYCKILLGAALILGLTYALFYWKKKKERTRIE